MGTPFKAAPDNVPRTPDLGYYSAGTGTTTVSDRPPYINIYNVAASSQSVSITMRSPGQNVLTVLLPNNSGACFPTGVIGLLTLTATISWFYSEQFIDWSSFNGSSANVYGQSFTGGTSPGNGIWKFLMTLTVASTAATLNSVNLMPLGILTVPANTNAYLYEVPVTSGQNCTIAGGTVISGWISPS
jgi:hypothetical protein